jgi:chromosome segregation protein
MYIVAAGYSFTGKRGIVGPGSEITEKDFASHEAFVRAVAKGKIIVGKGQEQLEKEAAERAQKQQEAIEAAAGREKGKALEAVKNRKETAAAAVQVARAALETAQTDFEKANKAQADAADKAREAQSAAITKRTENKALNDAYDTLVRATDELKNAKKPAEKTVTDSKVAEAKVNFAKLEAADAEYKTAIAAITGAEKALADASTVKIAAEAKVLSAKEAVTLAEAELEKASIDLAALEGK